MSDKILLTKDIIYPVTLYKNLEYSYLKKITLTEIDFQLLNLIKYKDHFGSMSLEAFAEAKEIDVSQLKLAIKKLFEIGALESEKPLDADLSKVYCSDFSLTSKGEECLNNGSNYDWENQASLDLLFDSVSLEVVDPKSLAVRELNYSNSFLLRNPPALSKSVLEKPFANHIEQLLAASENQFGKIGNYQETTSAYLKTVKVQFKLTAENEVYLDSEDQQVKIWVNSFKDAKYVFDNITSPILSSYKSSDKHYVSRKDQLNKVKLTLKDLNLQFNDDFIEIVKNNNLDNSRIESIISSNKHPLIVLSENLKEFKQVGKVLFCPINRRNSYYGYYSNQDKQPYDQLMYNHESSNRGYYSYDRDDCSITEKFTFPQEVFRCFYSIKDNNLIEVVRGLLEVRCYDDKGSKIDLPIFATRSGNNIALQNFNDLLVYLLKHKRVEIAAFFSKFIGVKKAAEYLPEELRASELKRFINEVDKTWGFKVGKKLLEKFNLRIESTADISTYVNLLGKSPEITKVNTGNQVEILNAAIAGDTHAIKIESLKELYQELQLYFGGDSNPFVPINSDNQDQQFKAINKAYVERANKALSCIKNYINTNLKHLNLHNRYYDRYNKGPVNAVVDIEEFLSQVNTIFKPEESNKSEKYAVVGYTYICNGSISLSDIQKERTIRIDVGTSNKLYNLRNTKQAKARKISNDISALEQANEQNKIVISKHKNNLANLTTEKTQLEQERDEETTKIVTKQLLAAHLTSLTLNQSADANAVVKSGDQSEFRSILDLTNQEILNSLKVKQELEEAIDKLKTETKASNQKINETEKLIKRNNDKISSLNQQLSKIQQVISNVDICQSRARVNYVNGTLERIINDSPADVLLLALEKKLTDVILYTTDEKVVQKAKEYGIKCVSK